MGILAFPAHAKIIDPPERTGWVPYAQAIAQNFWAGHGYTACEGIEVKVIWHTEGSLGGRLANAYVDGCSYISPNGNRSRTYTNVSEALNERGWMKKCGTIVHEYGHLVGLTHDAPFAVMRRAARPPECAHPGMARKLAAKHRWRAKHLKAKWRRKKSRRLARRYERAAEVNALLREAL